MQQWEAVSGAVTFHQGEAFLRLSPVNSGASSTAPPAGTPDTPASTCAPPWGKKRDDGEMLAAIAANKVPVHASRLPMSASDLRLLLNNVQKSLKLSTGMKGGWSEEANHRFLGLLRKAKRVVTSTPKALTNIATPEAVEDTDEQLVLANPGEQRKSSEKNQVAKNEHEDKPMHESAKDTKGADSETEHEAEDGECGKDPGCESDSSSSSSSSSTSSVHSDKVNMVKNTNTLTWESEWADAWSSSMYLLERSGMNKKKRSIAYNMLLSIKNSKAKWDQL